jgi:hypothetical protein
LPVIDFGNIRRMALVVAAVKTEFGVSWNANAAMNTDGIKFSSTFLAELGTFRNLHITIGADHVSLSYGRILFS